MISIVGSTNSAALNEWSMRNVPPPEYVHDSAPRIVQCSTIRVNAGSLGCAFEAPIELELWLDALLLPAD